MLTPSPTFSTVPSPESSALQPTHNSCTQAIESESAYTWLDRVILEDECPHETSSAMAITPDEPLLSPDCESLNGTQRNNNNNNNRLHHKRSGLAEGFYHVLTSDKRVTLSIPPDYIVPTVGSRNYLLKNKEKPLFSFCLCKAYSVGAVCHHGAQCDFIHCDPDKLPHTVNTNSAAIIEHAVEDKNTVNPEMKSPLQVESVSTFQVHWSTQVPTLQDALYERLPAGSIVYVKGGRTADGSSSHNAVQALASEMIYRTVGGEEALGHGSNTPLRFCKHYEREKCARGPLCHFIHLVPLVGQNRGPTPRHQAVQPQPQANQAANPAAAAAVALTLSPMAAGGCYLTPPYDQMLYVIPPSQQVNVNGMVYTPMMQSPANPALYYSVM